jgi:CRISPR-associated endonuclease/helicase Cas3
VRQGARERAEAMLRYASGGAENLLDAIDAAATFHDLGKLDSSIQAVLRQGRGGRLEWDHIDAGVAHLSSQGDWMAAWLVRAHHAPGLPEKQEHFDPDGIGRKLRGRRRDDEDRQRHADQKAHTDAHLQEYLRAHEGVAGLRRPVKRRPVHGLTTRLALSCLVDADHSDTAFFDTGQVAPTPPAPRWAERLAALRQYVAGLPTGATEAERSRNRRRSAFFEACLNGSIEGPLVACEGPVGLGKTTAVAAYLIRRASAMDPPLRRLIVVAPYTNILSQTAKRLRQALVLPGERPHEVVVEHHHRADFEHPNDRDLAVLWRAPIVLTTAVSFFETLAANDPSSLRKLHALPGSAIFLDEAHAALPAALWRQNWKWVSELAEQWGCRFVFASGSLARFWEDPEIIRAPQRLPELLPPQQEQEVLTAERSRVSYEALRGGRVVIVRELIEEVERAPGPRLVILNTVQNAAVVANSMRDSGFDVLHLSTALTPRDRERILKRVMKRLEEKESEWTLVATSCVEAGVDLSFRSAFRERFAVSSILQVGGRVNRHGEHDSAGGGIVYDFALDRSHGITEHPAARVSADVLRELMATGALNQGRPGDLVTKAMRDEISRRGGLGADTLSKVEAARNYPAVKEHGRVIDAETRLVVVDERLKALLSARRPVRPVSFRSLLSGSVQLWATKIEKLKLREFPGRRDLYVWDDIYEPDFLGYMAGVLRNDRFFAEGGAII